MMQEVPLAYCWASEWSPRLTRLALDKGFSPLEALSIASEAFTNVFDQQTKGFIFWITTDLLEQELKRLMEEANV